MGAGQALLLTGDAELADEDAMLAHWQPDALAADVLVVGHHGSRTPSGQAFYRRCARAKPLISAGYRNRYHHPHPAVWTRLADAGARWRTDRDGALRLTSGAAAGHPTRRVSYCAAAPVAKRLAVSAWQATTPGGISTDCKRVQQQR